MISAIFEAVTQAVQAFAGSLSSAVTAITNMFYVASGDNAGLTTLGNLLLIGVGVGLVYWVFRLIRGLISTRRA